jgi:hypothetical protein
VLQLKAVPETPVVLQLKAVPGTPIEYCLT